jgi:D-3-phosphoglycerate dehydrogenase
LGGDNMYNILITDGLDKDAINKLKELNFNVIEQFYKQDELGDNLNDIDVIIVRSATKITKDIIDKACEYNKLKLIIRAGVGLDNVDVNYANSKGIKVSNTPNASSESVAELTIGHIFSLARFINISNVEMREGKWEKKSYKGTEINGKTLGLIGFGRIAKEVAKKAHALGMKVIYNDTLGKVYDYTEYKFCSFDEIVQKSDFISLHIPYDKQIGPIITNEEIKSMKNGVYIINCARGPLVREDDLLEALNSGKISGAGLDVFEVEPTKNLELLNHPRVSVTPHIGASTKEAQEKIGDEVINIIKDHFDIKMITNIN